MKNLKVMMMTLMTCLITMVSFGQTTKDKQLSNAEIFSAKDGTLIEKQFIGVGKCKSVEVKILKLKDLNDNTVYSALRLEYVTATSYSTDTKIASLDKDEIDGLIKSIKNLQTNVFTTTRDVYTEVTFKSRTGFECGAYYDVNKGVWRAYMQLEKYDSKSNVFLSVEELYTFLSLVEQAELNM